MTRHPKWILPLYYDDTWENPSCQYKIIRSVDNTCRLPERVLHPPGQRCYQIRPAGPTHLTASVLTAFRLPVVHQHLGASGSARTASPRSLLTSTPTHGWGSLSSLILFSPASFSYPLRPTGPVVVSFVFALVLWAGSPAPADRRSRSASSGHSSTAGRTSGE